MERGRRTRRHGTPRPWPAHPRPRRRRLEAGERLFYQGDPGSGLHWLDAGVVALRRVDARGNQRLVRIAFPGECMGHESLGTGALHLATAEALAPCQVRSLCAPSARSWLEREPGASAALSERLAAELDRAEELQVALAHWPVAVRLCWALLQLAERLAEEGGAMRLPISRQDLASWIGARPETLARAIRQLEERGVAHFGGRRVRFDQAALEAATHGLDLDQVAGSGRRAR